MKGVSWRRRAGRLALCAAAGLVSSASAQAPLQGLPVSQMAGGGQAVTAQPAPQPPRAPSLPALPVTSLDDRTRAQLDGPATISMTFPRPMPVQDALRVLVAGTPFSLVIDPDVTGTYAGELKEVTMRQALEAVLFPLELDYDVNRQIIRVFRRRHHTRLFDVNLLNIRRSHQRGIRSSVSLQGQPAASELSSATASDAFEAIRHGVQALLSPAGRVHVDRSAGLVQVTDFEDRLDQVGVYLEAVQLRASRQVRIAAHIIDVTMTDATRAAIDWTAVRTDAGAATISDATAGMKVQNVKALLDAIARQGAIRTIAAPRVLAMNNEPAVMRFGTQEVSFDVTSTTPGRDRAVTTSAAGLFAGLTLTVTAQIGADGIVQLSVSPTYSEKNGETKSPAGGTVPVMTISEADTLVRVQEGETVVIAGLLQDRTRVKPSAGVAGIFGGQARETVKSELVILLTPSVVVPGTLSSAPDSTGAAR